MKKFLLSAVVIVALTSNLAPIAFAQNRVGSNSIVTYKTTDVKSQRQIDEEAIISFVRKLVADANELAELEQDFVIESAAFSEQYDELVLVKTAFDIGLDLDINVEELNEAIDECNAAIRRKKEVANTIAELKESVSRRDSACEGIFETYVAKYGQSPSFGKRIENIIVSLGR